MDKDEVYELSIAVFVILMVVGVIVLFARFI